MSKGGICKNERKKKGLSLSHKSRHARLLHNDRAMVCNSQHFGVDLLCDDNVNTMIPNAKRVVKH